MYIDIYGFMVVLLILWLIHLVYTENKNGLNFPEDESMAVSTPELCRSMFLHFLHTYKPTKLNTVVYLCVCVTCSPQTASVRSRILAPRTKLALRSQDLPPRIVIPQQVLLCRQGLCSHTKVNNSPILHPHLVHPVKIEANAC